MFIVFEGIDGSGTTSQVKHVSNILRSRGRKVYTTREPSDRPIGRFIREILCGNVRVNIGDKTMGLLFTADRSDHIEEEIKPAIRNGSIVLCDRYYHSSLAYQSMKPDSYKYVHVINEGMLVPDLTVILDISVEESIRRRTERSHSDFTESEEFLSHCRNAYRKIFIEEPFSGRVEIINADQNIEIVTAEILDEIESVL
jgi:dTMP kinase